MESGPTSLQGRNVRARLLEWLEQHPLLGFFLMAFIFAWLSWLPLIIGSNGLGLVEVQLPVDPFFALGTFAGPALAAV
jgi:hypothetical protein